MTAYAAPMSDPTAVMGRRFLAYIIDGLIVAAITLAIVIPYFTSHSNKQIYRSTTSAADACDAYKTGPNTACFTFGDTVYYLSSDDAAAAQQRLWGLSIGLQLLNFVVLQGLTGASLGKLITGLRVVDGNTGQKAGFGKIVIRWLVLFVDGGCCIIGLVTSLTTKGHRRLGDMAASTNVVAKSQLGVPPMAPAMPMAPGAGWSAPTSVPPPGWAPPGNAPAAGWGPTPGGAAPGAPAAPAAPAAPGGNSPQWDEARKAYIQYDQARGAWLQFDDASQEWKPIDS